MGFAVAAIAPTSSAGESVTAPPAVATRAPLIPLDDFFAPGRTPRAFRVSPDGSRLVWIARVKGRQVLRHGAFGGGETKEQPVAGRIRRLRWLADNRRIVFIRDRQGDENHHLFVVDLDAKEGAVRNLTPFPGVKVRLRQLFDHDSAHVLIAMNRRDRTLFDLYRLNVATGKLVLVDRNPGDVRTRVTDRAGRVIARYRVRGNGDWVLEARRGPGQPWHTIQSGPFDEPHAILGHPPDGTFAWALSYRTSDKRALVRLDLETGAETIHFRHPRVDVARVAIRRDTYQPVWAAYREGRRKYHFFDVALAHDVARFRPREPAIVGFASVSRDWRRMVLRVHTDRTGSALHLFDRDSGATRLLRAHPIARYREHLVPVVPVSFPARDGMPLHGFLALPKGAAPPLPMVLKVHGGPWSRDSWRYDRYTQFLANRGYAVLSVNYRGSTGYGLAFRRALRGEFGGKAHDDLIDAVAWAVAQGIADPGRVAIYGRSYGGYAALLGMTKAPEVFAAGISVAGISDLAATIAGFPPYWRLSLAKWRSYAGDPDTAFGRADLARRSPIELAARVRGPLLIAHGANDVRVGRSNSERMVAALHAAGKKPELMLFEDEGHFISRRSNRRRLAHRIEAFLAKHLGGRAAASGRPGAGP